MSKMITLILTYAAVCLASAAPYPAGEDAYHQSVDYQGQGEAQHHVIDFQQYLQQNQAQQFQGHHQQPVQVFQHHSFQQNHNDVNHGIGHSQVHNTQRDAKILNYQLDTDGHSNYQYAYETDNGIRAQEIGSNTGDGVKMQGAYSYTGDDGQVYTVTYTADENGFHPSGAHLPTPPPMPEAIARSIEKNLQDEANGINDDGQYYHNQQSEQYTQQSEQLAHQAGEYTQQLEQYTQQSEQKPQISIAPKKYRPNFQVKDINQKQQPIQIQQPHKQIVVKQPRRQNNPQQVQQSVQQAQHQVTVQRPQHISFNSQQHQLHLQGHEPTKHVANQNPHYEQHASESHHQISQAVLHQQNLDSSHNFEGGFVPKYEVNEHKNEAQEPAVQKQHIVEYHLPAAQNPVTEERHKVEYIVPSMKQFSEQIKPDKERQVIYEVPIPTVTQHKLAQDYIGPAPVAEYQHYH